MRETNGPVLLCITVFEQLRHFTRTGNYAERLQRALPKRVQEVSIFMSGAHADIEAVFDYAPDAKLLAAAAQDDEWHDDDAGQSGITDRARAGRRDSTGRSQAESDSDVEATDSEDESASDLPVIARDSAEPATQPAGILSSSPERTKTMATQITFDSANRRRSYPPVGPGGGNVPGPKQKENSSVLQRLYGPAATLESAGTRGGGWDATPPSWVLELNATLRGIEERQRHLEQILGGAKDPDSASVTSAASVLDET